MGRTQEGQLRWLGPEKGVIHMAAGAILNAVWDLWARIENKPLWELVCDLEPEALVKLIDFKHIQDYVSKEEALALLKNVRPGWEERKALMKSQGMRAYTTSAGWLGYPVEKVKQLCHDSLAKGHRYFKMKVGSANVEDDIARADAIRSVIGYDKDGRYLMMDANQKWGVKEAIEKMKLLAKFKPLWIEEPTNCDDVLGHLAIAEALKNYNIGVATGEVAQSKVIFKQLLSTNAIKYCQIFTRQTQNNFFSPRFSDIQEWRINQNFPSTILRSYQRLV